MHTFTRKRKAALIASERSSPCLGQPFDGNCCREGHYEFYGFMTDCVLALIKPLFVDRGRHAAAAAAAVISAG